MIIKKRFNKNKTKKKKGFNLTYPNKTLFFLLVIIYVRCGKISFSCTLKKPILSNK